MTKTVLIPIARGSEEMECVIVVDMLRRAGIKVIIVSDLDIVTCSRGVKIIPDILFENLEKDETFDAIVLPGGAVGTENLKTNSALEDILINHFRQGKLIAAICAAPTILAFHNIINNGVEITSHPSVKKQLIEYDYKEEKVVVSDNIITSRGAGTAFDFSLTLIEKLVGKDKAKEVSSSIVY